MADGAIVQTIKIEVDGADQAASEINKVGQATEEVQKTAASTAGGTQELGKGLDQVSQKSGVSSRELRSLGKIMKEFGAGELAGTAVGVARIAMTLGGLGAALFAVGAAFSFVKDKMKEAEDAAKAVTQTFANLAKVSAESKLEKEAAFWGTTVEEIKKAANDIDRVADQLRKGGPISPLTTPETQGKAFVQEMERAGVSLDNLRADTKGLSADFQKTVLLAAQFNEKLAPFQRVDFLKGLKGLGPAFSDDVIKNIEKGSEALAKAQASAARTQAALDALAEAWGRVNEAFVASSAAPAPVKDWGEGLQNFISVLQKVGEVEHAIIDSIIAAFQAIPSAINASIGQVNAAIEAWVTTPVANAWQWIKDSFQGVLDWIAEKGAALKSMFTGAGAPAGAGAAGGQVGGSAGFAGGGLLGGRGTGTSDSNLAWVSRGEHIMPARAVAQPGVLAFLEALRRSGGNLRAVLDGMGRFALGGMVRAPLAIPAFAGGGMSNVTIQFPGLPEITGLRASSGVVDQLRQAAAMAQVRSGGRKPSRYS